MTILEIRISINNEKKNKKIKLYLEILEENFKDNEQSGEKG